MEKPKQREAPPSKLTSARWVTLYLELPKSHQNAVGARVRVRCRNYTLRRQWTRDFGDHLAGSVLLERLAVAPAPADDVVDLLSWGAADDPVQDRRVEYLANWATCRSDILDRHLYDHVMATAERASTPSEAPSIEPPSRSEETDADFTPPYRPPRPYEVAAGVFRELAQERFAGARNRDVLLLLDLFEDRPILALAALVSGSLGDKQKWRILNELVQTSLMWDSDRLYEARRKLRAFKAELLQEAQTRGFEQDEQGLVRYLNHLHAGSGDADEAAE